MFGRLYEPLKYGFSSEKHMFESLNKMVEFRGNKLYTVDHSAYLYFMETKNSIKDNAENIPALPVCIFDKKQLTQLPIKNDLI